MIKRQIASKLTFAGVAMFGAIAASCAQVPSSSATETAVASVMAAPQPVEMAQPEFFLPAGVDEITSGGRGGEIIRVTSLAASGPGTLRAALEAEGPRIIVFEVAGVIDLGRKSLSIRNPHVTIAGQTAPSPGVTLIKGGLTVATHDVIIQHMRIRPGDGNTTVKWDTDAISTRNAQRVVVDHCTLTWATDENLSVSGPRFQGETPEEWRQNMSRDILYSHNLIAEGLANATHPKFEHSKGSLIHDNASDLILFGNIYAHNMERSPLFKGGVRGTILNNLIYNPGQRAIHYNLMGWEWEGQTYEAGRMDVIGNIMRGGLSTREGLPMVMIGGDGPLELFMEDNVAMDRFGAETPKLGRYSYGLAEFVMQDEATQSTRGIMPMPSRMVEHYVLMNAGARPWERDPQDVRIIADVGEGRGRIIDSQEEVGGYPSPEPKRRLFNPDDWDLATMEPKNPQALEDGFNPEGI